jgi:hypothetical protein
MNIFNKIIILIIILFIINYLLDNKLYNIIKKCLNKIEQFININYLETFESNNNELLDFYKFLNKLITKNINTYGLIESINYKQLINNDLLYEIKNQLKFKLNKDDYTFENIVLLNDIYYLDNQKGINLSPIHIQADVKNLNNFLGTMIFKIDIFIISENSNNKYGNFIILNIKILDRLLVNEVKIKNNNSFDDHFVSRDNYNDLFIKSNINKNDNDNDTDNNLIPSNIELSAYSSS